MRKLLWMAILLCLCLVPPLQAWSNGGHMVVAYIAYQNLSVPTRNRVDALLKLNPMYAKWTKGVPAAQTGLTAFIQAATWPDCIKENSCSPGYTSDGGDNPPGKATDMQNIGYADMLMHKYWHFVDQPYSAGAPGQPPKTPNALTEILLLRGAIAGAETDVIKSYDVAWLEHLVGDIHQPLHATSRFTVDHPHGDAGGNLVIFCAKPCTDELHAYWDRLLGESPTVAAVTKTANALLATGKPAGADISDPNTWAAESLELAKTYVYVAPISDDNDPKVTLSPRPDGPYGVNASAHAKAQVTLAGYRLAALLNANLK